MISAAGRSVVRSAFISLIVLTAVPSVASPRSSTPPLDIELPSEFPPLDLDGIAKKNGVAEVTPEIRARVQGSIDTFMTQLREGYRVLEEIVALPDTGRTFRNTVEAMDDFYNLMEQAVNWPGFYAYVHPDPFVRAVGEEVDKVSSKFFVEVGSSRSLYLALKAFAKAAPDLTAEERYLLDENLKDFEDGGVALPDKKRAKFKALSKELSALAIDFSSHLRDYRDSLTVTREQLAGMDEDYIAGLKQDEAGQFILTLDYPEFLPYMDYGRDESVRRELLTKFRNRAKDKNISLLETITRLRRERTKLLGRPTYADYIISRRMAKTADRAAAFLRDVQKRVDRKAADELAELTELKRGETGDPKAVIEQWDRMYYSKMLTLRKYKYDPQAVKAYFQTDRVIAALLDICQKIYGIEFQRVPGVNWHEDVARYDVFSDGSKIGEFYMDLYPRPNKYTHAAAWGLVPHKIFPDGSEQLPASAVVTNFPKPAPDRPSLLSFSDVETFFHEFGHLIHGILSTTRFAQVSGTRVMRDFVEAPSQMFEKWLHDTAVLSTFAKHHQTGETIPADLVDRIVRSRNVVSGMETQRQLFYGLYDLTLHTSARKLDVVKLWFDLKKDIERMPEIPGTSGPAGFDHLMGYAAGYYGYMWSKMIAADLYEAFRDRGGLLSPDQGKRLRQQVLSQGGLRHPDELVEAFLDRSPKIDAFLRDLGIEE
ncbi:Zn-dependent oligopeptidase [bacterium]|nr:Zn-dependent oligopeptidase [bacterium]